MANEQQIEYEDPDVEETIQKRDGRVISRHWQKTQVLTALDLTIGRDGATTHRLSLREAEQYAAFLQLVVQHAKQQEGDCPIDNPETRIVLGIITRWGLTHVPFATVITTAYYNPPITTAGIENAS